MDVVWTFTISLPAHLQHLILMALEDLLHPPNRLSLFITRISPPIRLSRILASLYVSTKTSNPWKPGFHTYM